MPSRLALAVPPGLADCQDERSFPLNAVASMLLMVVHPDKS